MLNINIEFTKGVLFVRLEGILTDDNELGIENTITEIINDGGIRYLVFNISNLIIKSSNKLFEICEKLVKTNDGRMLMCGKDNYNAKYINVKDELAALREFSLC